MSILNKICDLAKAKDVSGLARTLDEHKLCIGLRQSDMTPIMLLAQQGEHEAVTFLIHHFNANQCDAIWGYALSGQTAQVDALLALVVNVGQYQEGVSAAYARGGYAAQVDVRLALGVSRDYVVQGYARGGHTAQVDALLALDARRDYAVHGYALGGHTAQVDALLALGVSQNAAVHGYAKGGHTAQVDALLALGVSRNAAVNSYAKGGHTAQVDALLALGADRNVAVGGYAYGGYIAQVNALLAPGADLISIANSYKSGGHTANPKNLLRLITLTNNSLLRKSLCDVAAPTPNPNWIIFSQPKLLQRANHLTQLMQKNHLSYSWACVFKPELNFLFLQGHLLMAEKRLPLWVLLEISSFISGFSSAATYTLLNRHYESHGPQLKEGRNTPFFRRQASLVNTKRDFLLIPAAELTSEDKALTLPKEELRILLYEDYPTERNFSLCSIIFSAIFSDDSSITIKQLKALLECTEGEFIHLEAVRGAIHRTEIDFPPNNNESAMDFVLTKINEKFIEAARAQQANSSTYSALTESLKA